MTAEGIWEALGHVAGGLEGRHGFAGFMALSSRSGTAAAPTVGPCSAVFRLGGRLPSAADAAVSDATADWTAELTRWRHCGVVVRQPTSADINRGSTPGNISRHQSYQCHRLLTVDVSHHGAKVCPLAE